MDSIHIKKVYIKSGTFSVSNDGSYVEDANGSYRDMIDISFDVKSNNVNYCTVSKSDSYDTIYFENFIIPGKNRFFFPIDNNVNIKKLSLVCYNFIDEGKVLNSSYNIYQYLLEKQPDIDNFFVNRSKSNTDSVHSFESESESESESEENYKPYAPDSSQTPQYSQAYYDLLNGNTKTKTKKNYTTFCDDESFSDEDESLIHCMICISAIQPKDSFSIINDTEEDQQVYHTTCLEQWLNTNRVGLIAKKKVNSYCTYSPNGKMIKLVFLTTDEIYKRIANDKLKISYDKRLEANKNGNFSDLEIFRNDRRYQKRRVRCIIS